MELLLMRGAVMSDSSAMDLAAAILEARPGIDQMQLHKLLYLVQAASLAWFEEPAFDERIEAWVYGPVVRGVAGHYKDFNRQPISAPVSGDARQVGRRGRWTMTRVLDTYGHLDGPALARLTKAPGGPWRKTRGALPDDMPSGQEIPRPLIAEHHRKHGVFPARLTAAERKLAQAFFDGDNEALADLFESATGVRPTVG